MTSEGGKSTYSIILEDNENSFKEVKLAFYPKQLVENETTGISMWKVDLVTDRFKGFWDHFVIYKYCFCLYSIWNDITGYDISGKKKHYKQ